MFHPIRRFRGLHGVQRGLAVFCGLLFIVIVATIVHAAGMAFGATSFRAPCSTKERCPLYQKASAGSQLGSVEPTWTRWYVFCGKGACPQAIYAGPSAYSEIVDTSKGRRVSPACWTPGDPSHLPSGSSPRGWVKILQGSEVDWLPVVGIVGWRAGHRVSTTARLPGCRRSEIDTGPLTGFIQQ